MPDLVFVGCYTAEMQGNGSGITTFRRDPGGLTELTTLPMVAPSWLTRHPALPMLYAANEIEDGEITSIRIDEDLVPLDVVSSGGAHPCHLAVTPDGRFLLCANYTGGSVTVFPLDEGGRIGPRSAFVQHTGSGPDSARQEAAHVHMVVPSKDSAVVSAVDLGTDEIRSYTLSDAGELTLLAVSSLPAGTGPRQLLRRPGSSLAYVVGELSGTIVTVRETSLGAFEVVHICPSTVDAPVDNLVAHQELHGDRLYVSNRGPDCVTEFTLDDLTPVTDQPCGANPRHFAIVDGTCFVAAQSEDAITAYDLSDSGKAELRRYPTGSPTFVLPVSLP